MVLDDPGRVSGRRGRVVMLVDNAVNGDSRVQKAARSAAEAGWDVTLLGRSPVAATQRWRLGPANVRLVRMPDPLARRRHEFRRAWLRWPLAYPPNGIAEHRAQWVKARRLDIRLRETSLVTAARGGEVSGRRLRVRKRLLAAELFAARVLGRWVRLRGSMLARARSGRRLRGPWDRAYTWFWRTVQGDRCWRRLEPGLWDYELAYGPIIDALAPDLIHANDFRMLGVGARAVIRARGEGRTVKLVWDAHEFLPGIAPWQENARWLPANLAHEREYAPYADAVVTVSDRLAELLQQQHGLAERPAVVLNAPVSGHTIVEDEWGGPAAPPAVGPEDVAGAVPDLRRLCGVGADVALLVYAGLASPKRGLDIVIEALPRLPSVHVALVVHRPTGPYMYELLARATALGVADRVHPLPYVEHWQVVPFLSAADAGVIPVQRWLNYEVALVTKFFEYSHARLPVIVSDVRTMAETVRSTGQGEVFPVGDVDGYVRAVQEVLARPERYRAAYDKPGLLANWTWEAQATVLDGVYARLLAEPRVEPVTLAGRQVPIGG